MTERCRVAGPPVESAQGRPALGVHLEAAAELQVSTGAVVTCRDVGSDGRTVGELEASVFAAALVIDRGGLLADTARRALDRMAAAPVACGAVAVTLPGAGGFRADAVHRAPLPYLHAFALAHGSPPSPCRPGVAAGRSRRSLALLQHQATAGPRRHRRDEVIVAAVAAVLAAEPALALGLLAYSRAQRALLGIERRGRADDEGRTHRLL